MTVVLALMSLLLLLPLTLALSTMGATELRIATNHRQHTQATYSCESGLEVGLHALQNGQPIPPSLMTPELGTVTLTYTPVSADEVTIRGAAEVQTARSRCTLTAWRAAAGQPWQTRAYRAD